MEQLSKRLMNWASVLEDKTRAQAERTAQMPFIFPHVALMPDAHLGLGATVGSVIPTLRAIIPAAVGVDIGCGMIALRTQQLNEPSSCGVNTQSYFAGTVPVKLASAYYRAEIPGSPSHQQAASKAVHESKYLTRITSMRVSPSSVGHGGRIMVSGRLQQDKGRWSNFGHQLILIVLKPKGSKVWYWIHKVRTSASGYFSDSFADPVTADWSAAYDGGKADFASSGSIHYVRVSGSASVLRLSPALIGLDARDLTRLPQ
jgi:hypothetical protein